MTATILQVLPRLDSGGVERGTLEMVEAIATAEWRPLVASAGGRLMREVERLGGTHITLPLDTKNPIQMRKNTDRLKGLLDEYRVDLVHARSRAPAWSAERAARAANIPFITTFHGTYGLGPLGAKKPYNAVMTRGDRVIAISDFIRRHLIEEYAVPDERIVCIPRGVDLTRFRAESVSPERMIALSEKWRLPDGGTVLMLPSRLSDWKGHGVLLDALKILQDRNALPEQTRCLFVGEGGSMEDTLRAGISERNLDGIVHLVGHCTDMAAAYMVTDLVISASTKPEAFGRTVAEAAALGRPVIAPDHGGAPEIVIPGVTGWLFTASDPVSLANKIERALTVDRATRDGMAAAAVDHIRSTFDVRHMQMETLDVYRSVLGIDKQSAA